MDLGLDGIWGLYGIPGIEAGLAVYKANALPPLLVLWPLMRSIMDVIYQDEEGGNGCTVQKYTIQTHLSSNDACYLCNPGEVIFLTCKMNMLLISTSESCLQGSLGRGPTSA